MEQFSVLAAAAIGPVILLAFMNPAVTERLGPNGWVGIRIDAAMQSPAAWNAAHAAAWPTIRNLCVISLAVGAVCLVGYLAISHDAWLFIACGVSVALTGLGVNFAIPGAAEAAMKVHNAE